MRGRWKSNRPLNFDWYCEHSANLSKTKANTMRGPDVQQDALFSAASPETRVPKDHPLRPIRRMVDEALKALDSEFAALYSIYGRESMRSGKLLRAQLLMEQLDYNLLFRWFMGFSMDDAVWDHSTFTKNRDRLLDGDVARQFFAQVLGQAQRAELLSKEHFSVDGTMIEALASLKSYCPKDEEDPAGGGVSAGSTFVARSAVVIPINRRPTKRRCCTRKVRAWRPS